MAYAENVIYAKVKALYGKRLTLDDYNQLLSKGSVGEVAAYLRRQTIYADALQEVKEELIHRGQFENLIRKHLLNIVERLIKYDFNHSIFFHIYAMRNEIEQLLAALRMLGSGSMEQFIVSFPAYLNDYLSFDLFSLAKITSYDDLLEVVRHSEYYTVLGPFRPLSNAGPPDIVGVERALLAHYFQIALDFAEKHYHGEALYNLKHLLQEQIDIENLKLIYRMSKFFGESARNMWKLLLPEKGVLSPNDYRHILQDGIGIPERLSRLEDVYFLRRWKTTPVHDFEHKIDLHRQYRYRNIFRFSTSPVVVLMSYMTLMEIERDNLFNIIEGIRYAVPADTIRSMLII